MGQRNPFVPQVIKDRTAGPRRSVAPVLGLVDTTDPAFRYIAVELKAMADAGVELDEASTTIAIKVGRQKYSAEAGKRHAVPKRQSIVYYIRRGEVIKIGTTTNPAIRFKSLMPDEILAHEPGGPAEESQRHRQFSWCRVARKGEYFRPTQRLMAHIAAIREQHGEPDVAWPTVASLGTGYARTKVEVKLPEPTSGELTTAAEGARLLGMSKSTIHGWAHRGLIKPAGRNDKGHPMYFVDHLRFLIQRNREWLNRGRRND